MFSAFNFFGGYYRYERDTSPVIRALLLFNILGTQLLVLRAIDPDGTPRLPRTVRSSRARLSADSMFRTAE